MALTAATPSDMHDDVFCAIVPIRVLRGATERNLGVDRFNALTVSIVDLPTVDADSMPRTPRRRILSCVELRRSRWDAPAVDRIIASTSSEEALVYQQWRRDRVFLWAELLRRRTEQSVTHAPLEPWQMRDMRCWYPCLALTSCQCPAAALPGIKEQACFFCGLPSTKEGAARRTNASQSQSFADEVQRWWLLLLHTPAEELRRDDTSPRRLEQPNVCCRTFTAALFAAYDALLSTLIPRATLAEVAIQEVQRVIGSTVDGVVTFVSQPQFARSMWRFADYWMDTTSGEEGADFLRTLRAAAFGDHHDDNGAPLDTALRYVSEASEALQSHKRERTWQWRWPITFTSTGSAFPAEVWVDYPQAWNDAFDASFSPGTGPAGLHSVSVTCSDSEDVDFTEWTSRRSCGDSFVVRVQELGHAQQTDSAEGDVSPSKKRNNASSRGHEGRSSAELVGELEALLPLVVQDVRVESEVAEPQASQQDAREEEELEWRAEDVATTQRQRMSVPAREFKPLHWTANLQLDEFMPLDRCFDALCARVRAFAHRPDCIALPSPLKSCVSGQACCHVVSGAAFVDEFTKVPQCVVPITRSTDIEMNSQLLRLRKSGWEPCVDDVRIHYHDERVCCSFEASFASVMSVLRNEPTNVDSALLLGRLSPTGAVEPLGIRLFEEPVQCHPDLVRESRRTQREHATSYTFDVFMDAAGSMEPLLRSAILASGGIPILRRLAKMLRVHQAHSNDVFPTHIAANGCHVTLAIELKPNIAAVEQSRLSSIKGERSFIAELMQQLSIGDGTRKIPTPLPLGGVRPLARLYRRGTDVISTAIPLAKNSTLALVPHVSTCPHFVFRALTSLSQREAERLRKQSSGSSVGVVPLITPRTLHRPSSLPQRHSVKSLARMGDIPELSHDHSLLSPTDLTTWNKKYPLPTAEESFVQRIHATSRSKSPDEKSRRLAHRVEQYANNNLIAEVPAHTASPERLRPQDVARAIAGTSPVREREVPIAALPIGGIRLRPLELSDEGGGGLAASLLGRRSESVASLRGRSVPQKN